MKKAPLFILIMCLSYVMVGSALAASLAKITASDAEDNAYFGYAVGISGDYAIAGATLDDKEGSDAGAAYIFHRTATNTWDAGTKITASDAEINDQFGMSVGISGSHAIVGAPYEGDTDTGAIYIYYRTDTTWDGGTKIVASDAEASDYFGWVVAISGDYAIVGAPCEDAGSNLAGAAYIFQRTGANTWDEGVKIVAGDPEAGDLFGYSVGITSDYAVVGAHHEDSADSEAGAAYIFHRTGDNTWDAGVKVVAGDAEANDYFGRATGISGDYAIVGAYGEDTGGSDSGAAYVFHRTGLNAWDTGTKIVAADAQAFDSFGWTVAISGPYAAVGAYGEDSGGTDTGAMYLYSRTGETTWSASTKFVASDATDNDNFGYAVSLYGYYAIAGAIYQDPGATTDAGSAYIINHDLPAAIDLLAFEAEWADAGAALHWMTGSETECGAFTLLRCELAELWNSAEPVCAPEEYQELDIVIPCQDSAYGAEYAAFDVTADPSASYSYLLREYETTGGVNEYGPVTLYSLKYGNEQPEGTEQPADDDDNDLAPPDDPDSGQASDDDEAGAPAAEGEDAGDEADEKSSEEESTGCGW